MKSDGTVDQEVGVCALAYVVLRPTTCLFLGSGSQLLRLLSPATLAALGHPLPTFTQQPLPTCPQPGPRHGGGGVGMPTPWCLGVGHGGFSPCPTLAELGCIHGVLCRDKLWSPCSQDPVYPVHRRGCPSAEGWGREPVQEEA